MRRSRIIFLSRSRSLFNMKRLRIKNKKKVTTLCISGEFHDETHWTITLQQPTAYALHTIFDTITVADTVKFSLLKFGYCYDSRFMFIKRDEHRWADIFYIVIIVHVKKCAYLKKTYCQICPWNKKHSCPDSFQKYIL
jgi:hypothetical protein